jgi:hypothetical protein
MLTVATDDDTFQLDVEPGTTLELLAGVLEAETGVPAAEQALLFNGTLLGDRQRTLASYGVGSDDLLMLQRRPAAAAPARGAQQGGAPS